MDPTGSNFASCVANCYDIFKETSSPIEIPAVVLSSVSIAVGLGETVFLITDYVIQKLSRKTDEEKVLNGEPRSRKWSNTKRLLLANGMILFGSGLTLFIKITLHPQNVTNKCAYICKHPSS